MSHGKLVTVSSQISEAAYKQVSQAAKARGISVSKYLAGQIESTETEPSQDMPVRKVGSEKGSLILRIPRDLSEQIGVREGSYVRVRKAGRSLIVTRI